MVQFFQQQTLQLLRALLLGRIDPGLLQKTA
jgi:hypothetical protein